MTPGGIWDTTHLPQGTPLVRATLGRDSASVAHWVFLQDAANQNYGTVVAGQVSAAGAVQLSDPADVFAAESVHYLRAAKLSDTKVRVLPHPAAHSNHYPLTFWWRGEGERVLS
jgi:hypothetical protein